jgi:site-specific recombinase XerD
VEARVSKELIHFLGELEMTATGIAHFLWITLGLRKGNQSAFRVGNLNSEGLFAMPDPTNSCRPTPTLSELVPEFLLYAEAELRFAKESVTKYQDCLRRVLFILGDRAVTDYSKNDLLRLKQYLLARGLSVSRQVSILLALKRFLLFCRDERNLPVLDPYFIVPPKRPRREVVFLTTDEVERFVGVISLDSRHGQPCLHSLRFRALVEVLLGTAMRIGEVLSLNLDQIDWPRREAKVIGKGGKEQTVFFTARALYWLKRYLDTQQDDHLALFVSLNGKVRLSRADIWRPFTRYRKLAGLTKRVTPHLLRHTAATQLLFNGCPIGHIKEILGHARLETTCRYYLGLDHRAAKEAHRMYMVYSTPDASPSQGPAKPHPSSHSFDTAPTPA